MSQRVNSTQEPGVPMRAAGGPSWPRYIRIIIGIDEHEVLTIVTDALPSLGRRASALETMDDDTVATRVLAWRP